MKNPYLSHLKKIEFVITNACTGRCKHCSQGDHTACPESIDPQIAAETVREIAKEYALETVMTFGGEPLLYPDAVCAVMSAARDLQIAKRQVITNGFFSSDPQKIQAVTKRLAESGVNDLLLSVDAFHQECIPLDGVRFFAETAKAAGVSMRLSPAWLVSATDDNPYNRKTHELLGFFADLAISVGEGNVVFPEGNARKYFAEYFVNGAPQNPYEEDPFDVRCVSVMPNGDVLGGNLYRTGIAEILKAYTP